MNDMSAVIIPKSDQMNSDDLIGGARTITITGVEIRAATEQPVSIHFEGDEGKPWKPCKSMSRVLVQAWGPDASKYTGRSLTLFRDPKVKWGGLEVGGIRISHMSHIDGRMQMALTETRGKRTPFTVLPLADAPAAKPDAATTWANAYLAKVAEAVDTEALDAFVAEKAVKLAELEAKRPDLHSRCTGAVADRRAGLSECAADEPFDAETGEIEPEPEESPPDAKLAQVRASIAAAKNLAGLKHVDGDWVNVRGAYDDDETAEIDALIAARREALAG